MITYFHTRGKDFTVEYHFEKMDDTIPAHKHEPDHYHDILVLEGCVLVNNTLLVKGDLMTPKNDELHEIVALVPGTVTLHTYLNGEPEQYKNLTLDELKGVIQ